MGHNSEIISETSTTWTPVWAASLAAGVVAGIGIVARIAALHNVSPVEDLILRALEEQGVSIVLRPNWTEPLVGLTEILGFAALGAVIGLAATLLRWSAMRAISVAAVLVGAAQLWFGLLARLPL